jgi:hypothetical protein
MKVTLVDTEIEVAKHIAQLRTERSRQSNAKNTPYGDKTQLELDIDAFGAELAFCKMYNYYPDLTTYSRKRGPDCYTTTGKRIDVKQSSLKRGGLIVSQHKTLEDADIYVLMRGEMPTFKYEGWAWAHEVIRSRGLQAVGRKEITCYVLDKVYLRQGEPGHENQTMQ